MHTTLTEAIAEYIKSRKLAKLEPLQKKLDRALDKGTAEEQRQAQQDYASEDAKLSETYDPVIWLSNAAQRAKQISLSTHSAKFIHSDAKSSSCLDLHHDANSPYLASCALPQKDLDASGNAAALDVARLLKLQVAQHSLVEELRAGHVRSLWPFSDDVSLRQQWLEGFSLALSDSKVSSHNLAKQVYFPLADGSYHLLLPLYASSLAHAFHKKITDSRFGEAAKSIREAKKKQQYHSGTDVNYPNTLLQSFGGSKPQNISQLNSERYGQNFLLPCTPPQWQSQAKAPSHLKTLFDRSFTRKLWPLLNSFRSFLESVQHKTGNLELRQQRDTHYLQNIIDEVFNRAAHYQALRQFAGWSQAPGCELAQHYALWLDPWHTTPQFQQQRRHNAWQAQVSADFARWINQQLGKSKTITLDDSSFSHWQALFAKQLQAFDWSTPCAPLASTPAIAPSEELSP